jgi:hypothetical protein
MFFVILSMICAAHPVLRLFAYSLSYWIISAIRRAEEVWDFPCKLSFGTLGLDGVLIK